MVESMFEAIQEECIESTAAGNGGSVTPRSADVEARLEQLSAFLQRLAQSHPLLLLRHADLNTVHILAVV